MKWKLIFCAAAIWCAAVPAYASQRDLAPGQGPGASATTCSQWKAICEGRGGRDICADKFNSCLKSGCFVEAPKFGGASHCQMQKK